MNPFPDLAPDEPFVLTAASEPRSDSLPCDWDMATRDEYEPRPCGRRAVRVLVHFILDDKGGSERHPSCQFHRRFVAPDGWRWVPAL